MIKSTQLYQINDEISHLPVGLSMRLPYAVYPIIVKALNVKEDDDKIFEINDWLVDMIDSDRWTTVPHCLEITTLIDLSTDGSENKSHSRNSILFDKPNWLYDVNYYLFKSVEDFLLFKLTWM